MTQSYTPVQYIYQEVILEQIERRTEGKIFYFTDDNIVESCEGRVLALEDRGGEGLFVRIDSAVSVRVDRIITLFGKPGAAYDEYDGYANACMDCSGG